MLDNSQTLGQQLFLVLVTACFMLYPTWADAAVSIFACFKLDDGVTGDWAEYQKVGMGISVGID